MRRATEAGAVQRLLWALAVVLAVGGLVWLARDSGREPVTEPATETEPETEPMTAAGRATEPTPRDDEPAPKVSPAEFLRAARGALPGHPRRALSLIEEADARFGDDDEARRALEIEVYVALGQIGRSRALTRRFYQRYPDSEAIPDLERLTGYHPRPEGPEPR